MALGHVSEIWRYPVKSMRGERLERAEVTEAGIVGDRMFGILDEETGHVLSAKRHGVLLEASAVWDEQASVAVVTLADGTEVRSDDPGAADRLSSWLERPVRLAARTPGRVATFEDVADFEADVGTRTFQSKPGSLFDSWSVLHVLTESSLRAAAALYPGGGWEAPRFRPNLLVDPTDDGFAEDGWVGHHIAVGLSVVGHVRKRTGRCALTTRPQPGLPRDLDILRVLARERAGDLGVYVDPTAPGALTEGDEVRLEG